MRLLISWVREFVDVTASAEELADCLSLRGFEVASIEPLGHEDAVIDFEVTANRPDCLSVLGFARELATAYNIPLRVPSVDAGTPVKLAPLAAGESDRVRVTIEDEDLCPRYAAAVAEVAPAATPGWMASRLQAAGIRPISAIVDVTNYVLMEIGHPMHAFDLERLGGREIRIRRARPGETITTLDGVARRLDADMLVIADAATAQAVAGVMGGADSEVSADTRLIAFESACFKPSSVRRTSKRLGIKTEASARFERGADVNAPFVALQRAVSLMEQIGAGRTLGAAVDRYPRRRGPQRLHLRRARLAMLLGLVVPDREVERILRGLGFDVEPAADGWQVLVPTYRVDLLREVDLIEEVGRHHGFDRIEAAFPAMTVAAPPADPRMVRDRVVRRVLLAAGLSEAVTFGFIEARAADVFALEGAGSVVGIANPLSAKFETLRPSLVPGLVDAVAHNRRHGREDVALFEIGARFSAASGESRAAAFAWTGAASPEHWSAPRREVEFFDAKGIVEAVCASVGAPARFEPATAPFLVAGQTAAVFANGRRLGLVGLVSPAIVESRGAPRHDRVFAAELDLDALPTASDGEQAGVRPLPRYPAVVRDLSIVVPDTLPAAIIRGTIQTAADRGPAPLVSIGLFDRYTGKGVAEGSVSLSLRLTFRAPDRTLTDGEVQHSFDTILAALVREHQAVQR